MNSEKLKYFELAKKLNSAHGEELLRKRAHFRGNVNSCSLISLDSETPEIGESGITESNAKTKLSKFNPRKPKRKTPEKSLQSWIILSALRNNYILPFGKNLTFITSELAIKRVVNDILAINENNDLVVIELKTKRVNEVKDQALKFKDLIWEDKEFFGQLTELMAERPWSGKIKCAVVWPKSGGRSQRISEKHSDIEEYQYS